MFFHHIPRGTEVYIHSVFGCIAFKLFNLGQMFWVDFHKQSWCNSVRFVGLLDHMRFFSSAHNFSIGLRSGLSDGRSNTLTLLSLSHFATTLEVCLGSLSIWKTHLRPIPQYIQIIFLSHDAIYFVKRTNPSCSKPPP